MLSAPRVSLRSGRLEGSDDGEVTSYLGVPYAKAPVGSLRFRPTQPVEPWSGIRQATAAGPLAPQAGVVLGGYVPGDPTEQGEDCLSLNIYAPSRGEGPYPVMVFFHGGAFVSGTGSSSLYDASSLARKGVVVVTFNYRLGVLGFLAHPCLYDQKSRSSGNWGLSDQLALLGWVRENISAFRGDPNNVTAFGESAGAMSIADLLGAEQTKGLFHRAILQSGSIAVQSFAAAKRTSTRLFELLGIDPPSRERLEGVPVDELLAVQAALDEDSVLGPTAMRFRPVVDGGILAAHPAIALQRGAGADVAVLAGTNRDEFSLFTFSFPELAADAPARLVVMLESFLHEHGAVVEHAADDLVTAYQSADPSLGTRQMLEAIGTDLIFWLPMIRLLDAKTRVAEAPTYSYLFDWESPLGDGRLGACHALELPFVFGTLHHPLIAAFVGTNDEAGVLSEAMQLSWAGFATCGDPSTELLGTWPCYELRERSTMRLGRTREALVDPFSRKRELFDRLLPAYAG